jgi:hypothetical protein
MVFHKFNHDIPFMKHRRNYGCKCLQMSQNVYFGKRSWFLWHNGLKFPIVMWHVIVWPFKMCMGWLLVTNIFLMWILNACVSLTCPHLHWLPLTFFMVGRSRSLFLLVFQVPHGRQSPSQQLFLLVQQLCSSCFSMKLVLLVWFNRFKE